MAMANRTWSSLRPHFNDVDVLLGQRNRRLPRRRRFRRRDGPLSVAVADFNGDGNQDLAVANFGSDNVSVLLGRRQRRLCRGDELHRRRRYQLRDGRGLQRRRSCGSCRCRQWRQRIRQPCADRRRRWQLRLRVRPHFRRLPSVAVAEFNGDGIQDLAVAQRRQQRRWHLVGQRHWRHSPHPITFASMTSAHLRDGRGLRR